MSDHTEIKRKSLADKAMAWIGLVGIGCAGLVTLYMIAGNAVHLANVSCEGCLPPSELPRRLTPLAEGLMSVLAAIGVATLAKDIFEDAADDVSERIQAAVKAVWWGAVVILAGLLVIGAFINWTDRGFFTRSDRPAPMGTSGGAPTGVGNASGAVPNSGGQK